MSDDREDRIKARSYQLWEDSGRPHGRHHEHWQEAERQVAQEDEKGVEMYKIDEAHEAGKPKRGSVLPDSRPTEEPANKSTQPPPAHTETAAVHGEGAAANKGRGGSAASMNQPTSPRSPAKKANASTSPKKRST